MELIHGWVGLVGNYLWGVFDCVSWVESIKIVEVCARLLSFSLARVAGSVVKWNELELDQ